MCIMQIVLAKQKGLNPDEPEVGFPTHCLSLGHSGFWPDSAAVYVIAGATTWGEIFAALTDSP